VARVLVVEDDPSVMAVVCRALQRSGHETLQATSGERAVALARTAAFDLVVVDNRLPGISGVEAFQQMRLERPALVGVAITGFASLDDAIRAREAGLSHYLEKPFSPAAICAVVDRWTPRHLFQKPERADGPAGIEPAAAPPGFEGMTGGSAVMLAAFDTIVKCASLSCRS
jgi:DNA-binding NtrC family response regulator